MAKRINATTREHARASLEQILDEAKGRFGPEAWETEVLANLILEMLQRLERLEKPPRRLGRRRKSQR